MTPNKPTADELLVRREQRAFWARWFWVLLLIGPCHAVAFVLFKQDIVSYVPMSYRAFAEISCSPVLALCLSAMGAGFCLAKLWFPRERLRDVLAYAFLIGFVLMAIYGGLFVAVSIVHALLNRSNPV